MQIHSAEALKQHFRGLVHLGFHRSKCTEQDYVPRAPKMFPGGDQLGNVPSNTNGSSVTSHH